MAPSVWRVAGTLPLAGLGGCVFFSAMLAAEPSAGPVLVVSPRSGVATSGSRGGPFNPPSFQYRVSATTGSIKFAVTTPAWLTADPKNGTTDPGGVLVNIRVNEHAMELPPGRYGPSVAFTNLTNGRGTTVQPAALTVQVPAVPITSSSKSNPNPNSNKKNYLLDHKGGFLRTDHGERLLAQ